MRKNYTYTVVLPTARHLRDSFSKGAVLPWRKSAKSGIYNVKYCRLHVISYLQSAERIEHSTLCLNLVSFPNRTPIIITRQKTAANCKKTERQTSKKSVAPFWDKIVC